MSLDDGGIGWLDRFVVGGEVALYGVRRGEDEAIAVVPVEKLVVALLRHREEELFSAWLDAKKAASGLSWQRRRDRDVLEIVRLWSDAHREARELASSVEMRLS